jgi:predicted metal-binding membrane protein
MRGVLRMMPAILLIGVAALCWAITARRMEGMDMGPGTDLGSLGWFAVVWATMMAAMMFPSLVPIGLGYARTVSTIVFCCGYLLTWVGAGVIAYGLIQGIRSLDLSWLAWSEGGPYLAGGVILAAALYELTPIKAACLRRCRDPELRSRRGLAGSALTGMEYGIFCVGSSWALTAALFAVGVMNLSWMIVVAALVALEKLLPWQGVAIGTTSLFVAALGLGVALDPGRVPGLTIPM